MIGCISAEGKIGPVASKKIKEIVLGAIKGGATKIIIPNAECAALDKTYLGKISQESNVKIYYAGTYRDVYNWIFESGSTKIWAGFGLGYVFVVAENPKQCLYNLNCELGNWYLWPVNYV